MATVRTFTMQQISEQTAGQTAGSATPNWHAIVLRVTDIVILLCVGGLLLMATVALPINILTQAVDLNDRAARLADGGVQAPDAALCKAYYRYVGSWYTTACAIFVTAPLFIYAHIRYVMWLKGFFPNVNGDNYVPFAAAFLGVVALIITSPPPAVKGC